MLYCKDKQGVEEGQEFIYEVLVYVKYDNFLSLADRKYFRSTRPLKVVSNFKYSKYIEVECELFSAPLKYLLDNNYTIFTKKQKNGSKKIIT
jgi:hypothetical protein